MTMSVAKISLDDDQKFALMKFRRSVHDVLQSHHDDYFLLRWLRARSWDTTAAEKMLRQSLRWRQQWEVDTALKDWVLPDVIRLYYPSGISGLDKQGAPVIVVPFAGLDVVGLLHSATRQDLIRTTIQILESTLKTATETGANQLVVIFDMEGFNLRQYAWRPAAEMVISLIQMYEANYPEILKACYIINAPSVFAIAFNVVKKFLNESTLAKIEIFKKEPKRWKAAILQTISADNLPKYLGGDLTDPDGNTKYTTKIKQGGKVPKSFYTKNLQDASNGQPKREHVTTVIKKGDKLILDFIVAEEGCFLRWDFKTDGHDIRFGVTLKDANGNTSPAIRHRRVAAHQIDESGIISCQAPATYTVTFDNSYSLLRSKKIHYCVYVTPPLNKMNIVPTDSEIEAAKEWTERKLSSVNDIATIVGDGSTKL
ncbi:SEC14-like protein 4 [Cylas formicarius]|uniref:SEC14-like protein 4 n=1 Tax=Cylas formicarius TaxID=197179 RepID=UPI002958A2B7|nr:SEC14-like protein 4 [Cylas formicarius]